MYLVVQSTPRRRFRNDYAASEQYVFYDCNFSFKFLRLLLYRMQLVALRL